MNPPDVREADRRIIRFCGRGEDRAEPDVVRAFALRCECLLKAVGGFSDHNLATCFASRDFDRVVILSDMHAFYQDAAGDFRVIVHDKWREDLAVNSCSRAAQPASSSSDFPLPRS